MGDAWEDGGTVGPHAITDTLREKTCGADPAGEYTREGAAWVGAAGVGRGVSQRGNRELCTAALNG